MAKCLSIILIGECLCGRVSHLHLDSGHFAQIPIKFQHGSLNPIGEKIGSLLNVYILC